MPKKPQIEIFCISLDNKNNSKQYLKGKCDN